MIKDKANNLVTGIQKRADSLSRSTSFPLSAQNSFNSSTENKAESLRKLADKFLFGGEIYLRGHSTKCTTTGLLEWKNKANRLWDVPLYEQLLGYFNDVNNLKCFLASQLPEINEYLIKKATILRDYNLDLQAKGVLALGKPPEQTQKEKRTKEWWSWEKERQIFFQWREDFWTYREMSKRKEKLYYWQFAISWGAFCAVQELFSHTFYLLWGSSRVQAR